MRAAALLFAALLAAPSILPACSIAVAPLEIDPDECAVDRNPPEPPSIEIERVTRGRAPQSHEDGTMSVSSCDDIGWIEIAFTTPPEDDRTPSDAMGFVAVRVDGTLPAGLELPAQPLRLSGQRTFVLHWIDGATNDQEPFDFSMALIAVDRAGNRSEPSEAVRVRHPGSRK